jgi:hypothetical protein
MGSLRSVTEFTVRSFCFLFVKMMKMIGVENCHWAKSRRFMFCVCVRVCVWFLNFEFGFSELKAL